MKRTFETGTPSVNGNVMSMMLAIPPPPLLHTCEVVYTTSFRTRQALSSTKQMNEPDLQPIIALIHTDSADNSAARLSTCVGWPACHTAVFVAKLIVTLTAQDTIT